MGEELTALYQKNGELTRQSGADVMASDMMFTERARRHLRAGLCLHVLDVVNVGKKKRIELHSRDATLPEIWVSKIEGRIIKM